METIWVFVPAEVDSCPRPAVAGCGGGGGGTRWLEVTLHEGKNREVRQIIEHLGLGVSKLERVRFGPYRLGWLQPGDVLRARMKPEVKRLVGAGWDWG